MTDSLRIFISHKMPTDTLLAEEIGARLALFGGNRVFVSHAGRFRYGNRWREEIQRELDAADWLIFLATGQNEDWGFCLFECGYFSNRMSERADRPKLLKTFCRRGDPVHAALKEFNALEISVRSMSNRHLAAELDLVRHRVQEGQSFAASLLERGVFPDVAVKMVEVGESTGALQEMLNSLADFYEEEIETEVSRFITLIEPLLLVIMGIVIAGVVLALYMPLFELSSIVNQ